MHSGSQHAALTICAYNGRDRRPERIISPTRNDAFEMGGHTPDASVRMYAGVMREQQLVCDHDIILPHIRNKQSQVSSYSALL